MKDWDGIMKNFNIFALLSICTLKEKNFTELCL